MQPQLESLKSKLKSLSSIWKDIFKILLALVLIGVVFSKTSVGQIAELSRNISWAWLLISFLFFCLLTALKSVQYWALLGASAPYLQILKMVVYQNALSNLVANYAGVISYFTMLRVEQNVRFKRSGIVFLIVKVGDFISMGILLFISAFLVWARIKDLHQITFILLISMAAGLLVFMATIIFRTKFVNLIGWVVHWLRLDRFKLIVSGLDLVQSLAEQDRMVFVQTVLLSISLSMVYMTATAMYFFSRAQIFHIPIDFWASVYILSIFQLISLIPIQILGGLGIVEFTLIYFYALFGITHMDIPAALIGGRILSYLFYLVSLLYIPLEMLLLRLTLKGGRKGS